MKSMHLALKVSVVGLMTSWCGLAGALPASADWADAPEPATAGWRMSTKLSASPLVPRPVLTSGNPQDADARFDLTVNNAPAAQVFLQLGAGTAYNILVSPDVSGNISIGLKNTTVPEAVDVLRELFGYDYRITGNRVFIYSNTVQTRIFRINYLQGRRQGGSDLRVLSSAAQAKSGTGSSGASASASSGGAGGASGGSGTAAVSVTTSSDADFWRDVKESLVAMVGDQQGRGVTINSGAGMIVVRATPAELRQVADYMRAVQITIERQVMLEAKIIEVQLTKDAQSGVNWSLFRGIGSGNRAGIVNVAPGTTLSRYGASTNSNGQVSARDSATDSTGNVTNLSRVATEALGGGLYGLAVQAANFNALITFLESQGDVQVLSSPRIATLNNQKAVLKVGDEERLVNIASTNTSGASTSMPTPDIQPFFSGISLDVTPQIDETGTVMLHIHPAITTVSESQKTINMGTAGTLQLPLATSAINETDSIVRVHDGHIVAIGGLMTQTAMADRNGLPGLSDIPIMGGLFRQRASSTSKRELVILIRPTIISEDGAGWNSSEPATSLITRPN